MLPTPRDIFSQLSQGISDGRWTALGDLYAEDTVVEHPQRPPNGSRMTGRKAVADRFAAMAGSVELRATNVVVHETTDPEVIVAEFDYDGRSGERTFRSANVQMLRIRDGLIVHSRDYHDYLRMAAARDGLAQLAEQYENAAVTVPTTPELAVSAEEGSRRGVIERLLFDVTHARSAELADLYAEDAHVTHPFHPSAPPLQTREELRKHFANSPGFSMRAHDLVTYEGTDPEVIIAEFTYAGGSERPFALHNIFVTRVRKGLIVASRDYGDHLALAGATGRLPALLASL